MNSPSWTIRTRSGLLVEVRPLTRDDAPLLVSLFYHLGSESRYSRFNIPLESPDPDFVWREAQRMAHVPAGQGLALIATANLPGEPSAPVGGARYLLVAPGRAEASIAVRDDCQRDGLGAELLKLLLAEARRHGVNTIVGTVQATNQAVWRLLRHAGYPLQRRPDGPMVEFELALQPSPLPES